MPSSKTCLLLLAEGSEEIEAVVTIDVLRRAGVTVTVAGVPNNNQIVCSRSVKIVPDVGLEEIDLSKNDFDIIVMPGGLGGTEVFKKNDHVHRALHHFEKQSKFIAAICAAPMALLEANVCKGKKLTSYPSFKDKLSHDYDYKEQRVVVDGKLITSRGPGTSFEFALELVHILSGNEVRNKVAAGMLVA